MSTVPTTAIESQFRSIDGVRIRCADTGGSQEPVVLLTRMSVPIWLMASGIRPRNATAT